MKDSTKKVIGATGVITGILLWLIGGVISSSIGPQGK